MNTAIETIQADTPPSNGVDRHQVLPLYDALRERRIEALARLVNAACAAGDFDEARRIFKEMSAGIQARSPKQIRLMESKKPNIRMLLLEAKR